MTWELEQWGACIEGLAARQANYPRRFKMQQLDHRSDPTLVLQAGSGQGRTGVDQLSL
jgi:hypothetical protein